MPRVCYRLSNMPKDRCGHIVWISWFKKFLKPFIVLKVLAYWDWPTSRMKKSSWVFKCWKMLKYIHFWTVHQRLNSGQLHPKRELNSSGLALHFNSDCLLKRFWLKNSQAALYVFFAWDWVLHCNIFYLVVFISRLGYRFCLL